MFVWSRFLHDLYLKTTANCYTHLTEKALLVPEYETLPCYYNFVLRLTRIYSNPGTSSRFVHCALALHLNVYAFGGCGEEIPKRRKRIVTVLQTKMAPYVLGVDKAT